MRIDSLMLQNFRNYQRQSMTFNPVCNVIFGDNAEGKTNLLEAIYFLSCGRSPRTRLDRELIRFDAGEARLMGKVFSGNRDFLEEVSFFRGKRRKILINRVPAKSAASLSEVFNTVFFSPDDLALIRDGAAARRRFLDMALCQLRPRYAMALSGYNRAWEHKNRILRDSGGQPDLLKTLPEFNRQMISLGAVLIRYRAQYILRLQEYAAATHAECSGGKEKLGIEYKTVSTVSDPAGDQAKIMEELYRHMETHAAVEAASRLCLSGPHKDDLLITVDGKEARSFCSQGQTRTAALSLKLAEREILKNNTGEYPVLLLDDVLSELDPKRQEFVLNRISGGQVFITCCEDDRLPEMLGGSVLHVKQGCII